MKNFEKYIDEILNADACAMHTAMSNRSCVCPCCKENCNTCIKDSKEWLLAECEPPVDWSNVPVDTKILVSQNMIRWIPRYFANYINGKVYTWSNGSTSFSAENDFTRTTEWEYAKLAEDGESE